MESIEEKLAREIAQAVEQIVNVSHAAAVQALDRAFRRTSSPVVSPKPMPRRATTARRCPEELAALRKTLHKAVCDSPGETMLVLAKGLGTSQRKLQLPMTVLKSEQRVKSVGFRNATRYFPLGE